jgi:hypothetical protein
VENLSQAQIAAAAGTVRDMAARALMPLEERKRRRTRSRPGALDRSRASEAFAHGVQAPPV